MALQSILGQISGVWRSGPANRQPACNQTFAQIAFIGPASRHRSAIAITALKACVTRVGIDQLASDDTPFDHRPQCRARFLETLLAPFRRIDPGKPDPAVGVFDIGATERVAINDRCRQAYEGRSEYQRRTPSNAEPKPSMPIASRQPHSTSNRFGSLAIAFAGVRLVPRKEF